MSIETTNQTRPNPPREAYHRVFPPGASKQNEPTFHRSDTLLALYVTPCPTTTYADWLSESPPPPKKRYFQTNLAPGKIGEMGKLWPAVSGPGGPHCCRFIARTPQPSSAFGQRSQPGRGHPAKDGAPGIVPACVSDRRVECRPESVRVCRRAGRGGGSMRPDNGAG